ncbi:cytochrome c3 family protein [Thiolapillus sp.]
MTNNKGRTSNALAASLIMAGLTFAIPATAGTIIGSKHDFSTSAWAGGEICIVCHTPHNATTITDAPLWNHEVTAATFTTYTSPTFDGDATIGQPDGSSVLCLSCHDGTVAVDSFGGNPPPIGVLVVPPANLGTDLSNDHPISFTYDAALAAADPGLFDPTTTSVTIGTGAKTKTGPISDIMLLSGKLQCASCHDVHNGFTDGPKLLRISNAGSALCMACHDK